MQSASDGLIETSHQKKNIHGNNHCNIHGNHANHGKHNDIKLSHINL